MLHNNTLHHFRISLLVAAAQKPPTTAQKNSETKTNAVNTKLKILTILSVTVKLIKSSLQSILLI